MPENPTSLGVGSVKSFPIQKGIHDKRLVVQWGDRFTIELTGWREKLANILFIEKKLRVEKLGIMYLSTALKRGGHEAKLVQTEKSDLSKTIVDFKPDFIAFSITSARDECRWAIELSGEIKSWYPVKSVFGGPHPTFFPEIIKEGSVDFVVRGFGEQVMVDIVEGNIPKGVTKGHLIDNMDLVSFPDRDFMYGDLEFRENPMKNFIAQRICPYNCSFCYSPVWKKIFVDEKSKFYMRRSVDNLLKEIMLVKKAYPLKKVYLLDDTLTCYGNWLDEFCDKYPRVIGLPFFCNGRTDNIDTKMIDRLHCAGLEGITFGVQDVNEKISRSILNRGRVNNDKTEMVIRLFAQKGVKVRVDMLLGLPVKNPVWDALNSLSFLRRNSRYISATNGYIFQPYPKLLLTKYCKDNEYLADENTSGSFYEDKSELNFTPLEKKVLFRLQRLWHFLVKYDIDITNMLASDDMDSIFDYEKLKRAKWGDIRKEYYGI